MLIIARLVGELFRKFNMPLVVGELVAGVLLGPSLFGNYYPQLSQFIFNTEGNAAYAINGITSISVTNTPRLCLSAL